MTGQALPDQHGLTTRQAVPSDRAAILSFVERSYQRIARWRVPDRWDWQFAQNPFRASPDVLPVFLALDSAGRIVGQSCVMLVPMQLLGRSHTAGWGCDLFVAPEWRGRGVARRLQASVHAATEVHLSLNMAAETRHLKLELGDALLDPIPVYELTVRYEASAIRQVLEQRFSALRAGYLMSGTSKLLAAIASTSAGWKQSRRGRHPDPSIRLLEGKEFGREHDELWSRVAGSFRSAIERRTPYLDWKYLRQPHLTYRILEAWRGEVLAGFVVFRTSRAPEAACGRIVDVVADPRDQEAVAALIVRAVNSLLEEGCPRVRVATSVSAFAAVFERVGFRRVEEMTAVVGKGEASAEVVKATEGGWLLGMGDGDWDQFPAPG